MPPEQLGKCRLRFKASSTHFKRGIYLRGTFDPQSPNPPEKCHRLQNRGIAGNRANVSRGMCRRYAAEDRSAADRQPLSIRPIRSRHRVKFRTALRVLLLSLHSRRVPDRSRGKLLLWNPLSALLRFFGFSAPIFTNCTKLPFGAIYRNNKNRAFASFLQTRGIFILILLLFIRYFVAIYTVCKCRIRCFLHRYQP